MYDHSQLPEIIPEAANPNPIHSRPASRAAAEIFSDLATDSSFGEDLFGSAPSVLPMLQFLQPRSSPDNTYSLFPDEPKVWQ